METEEEAKKAMEKFNHSSFKGRILVVNEAKSQEKKSFDEGIKKISSTPRVSYQSKDKVKDNLDFKLRKLRRRAK